MMPTRASVIFSEKGQAPRLNAQKQKRLCSRSKRRAVSDGDSDRTDPISGIMIVPCFLQEVSLYLGLLHCWTYFHTKLNYWMDSCISD
jgi:hypothetical protein